MVDARWPITRFGVDITKAVPQAFQDVSGTRVLFASLVDLPASIDAVSTPTVVTTSSYVIDAADSEFIIINRVSPVTTALTLPSIAARLLARPEPFTIIDISTAIGGAGHTITVTPDGAETIMRQATWTMFSTVDQLSFITLLPFTSPLAIWGMR